MRFVALFPSRFPHNLPEEATPVQPAPPRAVYGVYAPDPLECIAVVRIAPHPDPPMPGDRGEEPPPTGDVCATWHTPPVAVTPGPVCVAPVPTSKEEPIPEPATPPGCPALPPPHAGLVDCCGSAAPPPPPATAMYAMGMPPADVQYTDAAVPPPPDADVEPYAPTPP